MKIKYSLLATIQGTVLLLFLALTLQLTAFAQGTAFTYQGRLQSNGSSASGTYNLTFSLFNTNTSGVAIAVPVTNNAVLVTNGLFTVLIDFGIGAFTGTSNWLEIAVETNGGVSFTTLTPRQQLTPVPYAINAENTALLYKYGTANFFAGPSAGNVAMSGGYNTGVGVNALDSNSLGNDNTAYGSYALAANTSGNDNTANGGFALRNNMSGSENTANGAAALELNTSGSYNTANGSDALYANTTGSNNTANGYAALEFNTTGSENSALGSDALTANTSGGHNTAIGFSALTANTTGTGNTAIGHQSLAANVTGVDNTAIGGGVLTSNTVSENTGVGHHALNFNTTGSYNEAAGADALLNNTSGSDNTANGYQALTANTTGYDNTANGYKTLWHNTNGFYNTANGDQALFSVASGFENTANGYEALYYNIGSDNTANGTYALLWNQSGSNNTADGVLALFNNTSGNTNIALGYQAGYNLTTGGYNIDIGNQGVAAESRVIRIGIQGTQINTFIAGIYNTAVSGSAVVVNSSGQLGVAPSSRRFKENIRTMEDVSDVLYALQPVTFRYKPGIDPQGTPQFGLIAEEVEQVDPNLVVHDQEHGIYTVRYEAVNAMLLNEFLKEHKTVEAQNTEIQNLEKKLDELQAMVKQLATQK